MTKLCVGKAEGFYAFIQVGLLIHYPSDLKGRRVIYLFSLRLLFNLENTKSMYKLIYVSKYNSTWLE